MGAGARGAMGQAPARPSYVVPEQQQAKFLTYNLLLGAGIGGLGAVWNGSEGTAWERFLRGASRGALGGALLYEGKRLTHLIVQYEQPAYGLLAVGVHELGGSVVENASHDRAMFDRLMLHTGFVRWEWRPGAGAQARLMPLSAASFAYLATRYRMDVPWSLATLTPVFTGGGLQPFPIGDDGQRAGFALVNALYVDVPSWYGRAGIGDDYRVLAHELVHALQIREYVRATALHRPLTRSVENRSWYNTATRYLHLDVPYLFGAAYLAFNGRREQPGCYYNNWFEREAEVLAENRPVVICR